jgi:NADPH:quinone reductase-like Zn-dependent oxidoreductase
MMKAIFIDEQGTEGNMVYGDVEEPEFGPTDILVRTKAASVNRRDVFTRDGSHGIKTNGRYVLGMDGAGEVVAVGDLCTKFKVGDRVMGISNSGTYAEYCRMPEVTATKIPDFLSYEEAGTFPIILTTAWHMMVCRSGLKAGEDVLVMAAGSGVGTAAIQIAKLFSGRVFTTASTEDKLEKAKALGADVGINYTKIPDFSEAIKAETNGEGVNLVVDHIGSTVWDKCFASMKRGGRFVTCGVSAGHWVNFHMGRLWTRDLTIIGTSMNPREDIETIGDLVRRGHFKAAVSEVFPLQQALKAQHFLEESSFFGKVMLSIP